MACAKRLAEACSSGRSWRVLRLVSMASAIESGRADSLSKTAIFCSLTVLLENEILLRQPADRSAMRVGHGHEYVDQVDVDLERGRGFGLASGAGAGFCCEGLRWAGRLPAPTGRRRNEQAEQRADSWRSFLIE